MYGSSFIIVTRRPRASRMAAREAAAMPLPSEETTPPVTKIRRVMGRPAAGKPHFTGWRPAPRAGPRERAKKPPGGAPGGSSPRRIGQPAGLPLLRRAFEPAGLRFGVAVCGSGAGEAVDCAQAAIGPAIHSKDSNLAGVFMAF